MYDIVRTFFSKKYKNYFCTKTIDNPNLYFIIGMRYASNVKILLNSKYYQENDIACMG